MNVKKLYRTKTAVVIDVVLTVLAALFLIKIVRKTSN